MTDFFIRKADFRQVKKSSRRTKIPYVCVSEQIMKDNTSVETSPIRELIQKFEEKRPEIVFEWKDSETEAEGWVVINSLRGGSAGGGTRMRKGLNKHEVTSLAKTMEIKFSVSGPS